jgi:hypothetical protein
LGRKRTKAEALERLVDTDLGGVPLKGKPKLIRDAAMLGAAGLIMLDPLNRLADNFITIPIPMIAIPAHESHLLNGSPSMQIYIRAGETIVPTGGNVQDFEQGVAETQALEAVSVAPKPRKKSTAYQRKYKKAFASVKGKYKLKNGKWKKDGFKNAVKAAHRMCK